jgi:hypothetical protein
MSYLFFVKYKSFYFKSFCRIARILPLDYRKMFFSKLGLDIEGANGELFITKYNK